MESFAATERKACELARIPRSTFRYRADDAKDNQLSKKLTNPAQVKDFGVTPKSANPVALGLVFLVASSLATAGIHP